MTMVVPSLMVAAIVAWVLWDNRTWRKCETCGIKFKSYPLPRRAGAQREVAQ